MSNKEKKILVIGVSILLGVMSFMFVAGLILASYTPEASTITTEQPTKIQTPRPDEQATLPSDDIEDEMAGTRKAFIDGCTSDGSVSNADCGCMFDYLNNNLTNKEFREAVKEAVDGITPDSVYDAAIACS